jgi:hypothetical protein
VVRMRGDSMGETLRSGDFVVIDQADTNVGQPGIFAVLDLESGRGGWFIAQVELIDQSGCPPAGSNALRGILHTGRSSSRSVRMQGSSGAFFKGSRATCERS